MNYPFVTDSTLSFERSPNILPNMAEDKIFKTCAVNYVIY